MLSALLQQHLKANSLSCIERHASDLEVLLLITQHILCEIHSHDFYDSYSEQFRQILSHRCKVVIKFVHSEMSAQPASGTGLNPDNDKPQRTKLIELFQSLVPWLEGLLAAWMVPDHPPAAA